MRYFAFLFLAFIPAALSAQAGCPANVKAIPLRQLNQHQMLLSVSINHKGPYDFLLDTGTQMTVVDLSLAGDLHLKTSGNASVAGVSFQGAALYSSLDLLEVGDHAATNQSVVVYDMKNLRGAGFAIVGLLGEDFLSGYDVLIDKAHSVLCIDDTGVMLEGLKDKNTTIAHPQGGVRTQSRVEAAP